MLLHNVEVTDCCDFTLPCVYKAEEDAVNWLNLVARTAFLK